MGKIYEFKSREGNLAPTPENEKKKDSVEDKRPLLLRLDSISQKLFKEGPEAVYSDFDGHKRKNEKVKVDEEKALLLNKSDEEIIKELGDEMQREVIASDSELYQAYRERIMGEEN